jgi:hypothetical protein
MDLRSIIKTSLAVAVLLFASFVPGSPGMNWNAPPDAGSRGTSNVTIHGDILNDTGVPIPLAYVVVANASDFGFVNYTITFTGSYQLDVPNSTQYYLLVYPFNGKNLRGYSLHGYFPVARTIQVENTSLEENFTLEPAYEVLFEVYDPDGDLIDEQNFTTIHWSTRMHPNHAQGEPLYEDRVAKAVWTGCGNSTGFGMPCVLVTPDEYRNFWIQFEAKGFGKVNLMVDNATEGYGGPGGEAEIVPLNFDLARSQVQRTSTKFTEYRNKGYVFSDSTTNAIQSANTHLENAVSQSGMQRVTSANKCINASLWGLEGMEMDRAAQDIEENRKGNLIVSVQDSRGYPVEGANITLNQTSHDFLFGVFDQVNEVGKETYQQLRDIGVNYATAGFYWTITEPTEGNFDYDAIDNIVGVPDLVDMGFKVKAHAMIYLNPLVVPDWVKGKSFSELNTTVYTHVYTLVSAYADEIDIWNVINEASGVGANLGMDHDQMLALVKTGVEAIRDADPGSEILVNNGFSWFGEHIAHSFMFEEEDNYTMSVREYMDFLETMNLDYDIVGQQMYDGGYVSFFEQAGIGSGAPVGTFDMSFVSEVLDTLEKYNRSVHVTEQSVSGAWNESPAWKDVGYWHGKWSPEIQADFLTYFYTLVFSKPSAEAITWWDLDDIFPFMEAGALFDKNLDPKPVFYALRDFIANHSTNTAGATDENGNISFTAYGGDFNLTVVKNGVTVNRTLHITEKQDHEILVTLDDYEVKPDLNISQYYVKFNDSTHAETGMVTINITVRNSGDRDAPSCIVRALHGLLDTGVQINGDKMVGPLVKDDFESTEIVWNATHLSGVQNVTVILDPDNFINETNETNNIVTTAWTLESVPWGHLTGNVTEAGTEDPLANATVTLKLSTGSKTRKILTDENGSFSFFFIDTGLYNITVDKKDYHVFDGTVMIQSSRTADMEIILERITDGRISGVVKDANGKPILGVSLEIIGSGDLAKTNVTGYYFMSGISEGLHLLEASAPNYQEFTKEILVIANRTITVNFVLNTTMGILQGKITDALTGDPLPQATILLPDISKGELSGTDGSFIIINIPSGSYRVVVTREGYESDEAVVDIPANGTVAKNFALTPLPEPVLNGTVSGVVRDEKTNAVIANALVSIDGTNFKTVAGGNGAFFIQNVPPGTYSVTVTAKDYDPTTVEVVITAGNETIVEVKLRKSKIVNGDGDGLGTNNLIAIIAMLILVVLMGAVIYRVMSRRKDEPAARMEETEEEDLGDLVEVPGSLDEMEESFNELDNITGALEATGVKATRLRDHIDDGKAALEVGDLDEAKFALRRAKNSFRKLSEKHSKELVEGATAKLAALEPFKINVRDKLMMLGEVEELVEVGEYEKALIRAMKMDADLTMFAEGRLRGIMSDAADSLEAMAKKGEDVSGLREMLEQAEKALADRDFEVVSARLVEIREEI